MIRQGNHFVRKDRQWLLVEGPWFDCLEKLRAGRGGRNWPIGVRAPVDPLSIPPRPIELALPKMVTYATRVWYPVIVCWISTKSVRKMFRQITRELLEGRETLRGALSLPFQPIAARVYWLERRWDLYAYKHRRKRVWRFEDGSIPVDFTYTAEDYCKRHGLEGGEGGASS